LCPSKDASSPLPSGYAVRELCTESEGYYCYVVIVFEIDRPAQRVNGRLTDSLLLSQNDKDEDLS